MYQNSCPRSLSYKLPSPLMPLGISMTCRIEHYHETERIALLISYSNADSIKTISIPDSLSNHSRQYSSISHT